MRVLIWTQYFWPENFHINAVARSLQNKGVQVTVLTGKPNYPAGMFFPGYKGPGIQRERYDGIEVIRIPIKERGQGSTKGLVFNYLSFIISGYLFAPFALRGKRFNVVFVYAPSPLLQALPAFFVAWLKHAPTILWVQDIWPEALQATGFVNNKWLLGMVGVVVRYIYRFSNSILISSEGFRKSIERLGKNKGKIRFYPNSAEDTSTLGLASGTPNLTVANAVAQNFSIVFAGNIGTAQSCETIIEAATLLQGTQDIKFYLVGDGRIAKSITKNVTNNGLQNVIMTGRVAPEDMASIYASASVLLLSLRDEPALSATLPSKLQSYLAAGKPIIACSNGESAAVVTEANAGLTCPAGDAKALACAVLRLYEMTPKNRAYYGINGHKYFMTHYRLPDRVAELVTHFEDVVAQH